MTDQSAALSCSGLTKRYRKRLSTNEVVSGVDLHVPQGTAFGLLGPNGAGKTTTMLMAVGLLHPSDGESRIFGSPASKPAARSRVGFVPEKFQLPKTLTAREFVHLHGRLAGLSSAEAKSRATSVLAEVELTDRADDRLAEFSKGMQQRAAIAQALVARPDLLILDEPTSALDPLQRRNLRTILKRLHSSGTTIVLNSHVLSEVEDICDHVAVMVDGNVVTRGSIDELRGDAGRAELRVSRWDESIAVQVAEFATIASHITHDDGTIAVTIVASSYNDRAKIAKLICSEGIDLYEMAASTDRLEDMYLSIVGGASAGDEPSEDQS